MHMVTWQVLLVLGPAIRWPNLLTRQQPMRMCWQVQRLSCKPKICKAARCSHQYLDANQSIERPALGGRWVRVSWTLWLRARQWRKQQRVLSSRPASRQERLQSRYRFYVTYWMRMISFGV